MENESVQTAELLTIEQVAKRLKVGRRVAYRLVSEGEIRHIKISRKSLRVLPSAIDEYLERKTVEPVTPQPA